MAIVIATNIAALTAQRFLNRSTNQLEKSFTRLSSGLRVNSAKDDAAGFSISERMTSQIRGLNQALRNTNDAASLTQVADDALDETVESLQRMRELALQASSSTAVTSDRGDIWEEIDLLVSEIDRIADNTEYNSYQMLNWSTDGADYSGTFQIGYDTGHTLAVNIKNATTSAIGIHTSNVYSAAAIEALGADDAQSQANDVIDMVDSAIGSISDIRANLGAVQNRFDSISNGIETLSVNLSDARSRIVDVDIAAETSNLVRNSILQQAGVAVLAQANQQPALAITLLSSV